MDLLSAINTNWDSKVAEWYKELVFEEGKFSPHDRKEEKWFEWVKYFISNKGKKAIYIEEIKDWKVKLSEWEYTESSKWEKDKYKWTKAAWYWLEIMYFLIQRDKLTPKIPSKPVEPTSAKDMPKLKAWLFKSWLQWFSITDMVKWSKQFTDFIKHKLEQWSKVNSSKFAVKIWKALHLPEDVMLDLNSIVRSADKKNMGEITWEIGDLSPLERIKRINKIVTNAWSPTYELQAAMIVALSKFWHLYPWMVENEWSYLWYQRFGWKPNDEFFTKTKKKLIDEWKQFTEEALVILFLKEASTCKRLNISTSFWWEAKKAWKEWREWWQKSWEWDTESMKRVEPRINHAISEIKVWKIYNTFWILKPIWWKWWDAQQMNKIPFLLVMAWTTKKLNEDEIRTMTNYYWWWYPFSALWFWKDDHSIALFQSIIIKLSGTISPEAKKAAENMVAKQKYFEKNWYDKEDEYKKFIDEVVAFWDSYWSALSPKLSITWDPEIFLKKDEPNNAEYAEYYNVLSSRIEAAGYELNKWWFEEWFYNYNHSSPALQNVEKFLSKSVSLSTQWVVSNQNWKDVFNSVIAWIKDIKNKNFSEDKIEDKKYKLKIYQEYYRWVYAFVKAQTAWNMGTNFAKTEFWEALIKLWFNLKEDLDADQMRAWIYNDKINWYFENYLHSWSNVQSIWSVKKTKNVFEDKISTMVNSQADSYNERKAA